VIRIDRPYGNTPPPVPSETFNYHRDLCELPIRTGLKPLDIVQPEGGSWTVKGNLVEWQNWSIRVGFNAREGLVLHQVTYKDGDRVRPILHRASMVEMAVPYAAPQEPFTRKCAFDVGDYGLGNCAVSLALGCDCLGNIHYFDGVLNNSKGEPVTLEKAICMHEEDAGLLFKHVEYRTGHNESRRSRRLVLSFIATVVNYEYAMYWYFGQGGTISYDIKLTGELSTNMVSPEEDALLGSDYGTLVAPGVNAQVRQIRTERSVWRKVLVVFFNDETAYQDRGTKCVYTTHVS
jgi:primary-amine oxidase